MRTNRRTSKIRDTSKVLIPVVPDKLIEDLKNIDQAAGLLAKVIDKTLAAAVGRPSVRAHEDMMAAARAVVAAHTSEKPSAEEIGKAIAELATTLEVLDERYV